MIPFRNRLIFGLIKKIIVGIFKIIYKVLSFLNLQITLLVLLLGGLAFLTGNMEKGSTMMTVFTFALAISLALAVILTMRRLLGVGKKVTKKKGVQIVEQPSEEKEQESSPVQTVTPTPEKPKYFRVKQNHNYIMAEYPDRYELYKVSGGEMIKVRTDLKR